MNAALEHRYEVLPANVWGPPEELPSTHTGLVPAAWVQMWLTHPLYSGTLSRFISKVVDLGINA